MIRACGPREVSPVEAQEKAAHYQALQATLRIVPFGTLSDELAEKGTVSKETAIRTAVDSTIFLFPAAGALKAAGYATAGRVVAGGAIAIEITDSTSQVVEGYENYSKGERAAGAAQMHLALAQIVFSARELREFSRIKPGDFDAFKKEFLRGLPEPKRTIELETRQALEAPPGTVKAYRAQGRPLVAVDDAGNVSIARPTGRKRQGVAVHIGFDEGRAKMWINEKGRTQVVEFEVSESFLEKVRRTAQPEHGVVRDRTRPWKVDVDFADQYAIPPAMLDELESAIIQGSGKIHPARGL